VATVLHCRKYSIERRTSRFSINYYVRPDFDESYPAGSMELSRLERQAEDEFIGNLQHNCYRERSYRKCLDIVLFSFSLCQFTKCESVAKGHNH